jgi:hypothetical protein
MTEHRVVPYKVGVAFAVESSSVDGCAETPRATDTTPDHAGCPPLLWLAGPFVATDRPLRVPTGVSTTRSGDTELGGYSIIETDDIEAAKAIAMGCPHLTRGGGVEIGQLAEVPARDEVAS